METNEDETESSYAKVNVGIRTLPVLKSTLNYEALELGQTTSEYGETILANRHKYKEENVKLKQVLAERDKTIAELNSQAVNTEKRGVELAAYQNEIAGLKELVAKLTAESDIFKDKRLYYLFQHLKGKKDKVDNAYGDDFDIVYNSPTAVLIALIYSCKLNK